MKRKGWILFLALLLPGCVFVFLKIFGKNRFEVRPLYQEGVIERVIACPPQKTPYHIPPESLERIVTRRSPDVELLLFSFVEELGQVATIQKQLDRVQIEVKTDKVEFVMIHRDSTTSNYIEIKECILLTPNPDNIVLVDRQGRIRGHYNALVRDEVDRLIAEMQIILEP